MKRIVKILESRFQEELPNFIQDLQDDRDDFFSGDTLTKINKEEFLQRYLADYPQEMIDTYNLSAFIQKINQTLEAFPNISSEILERNWDIYLNSLGKRDYDDTGDPDSAQIQVEFDDERSILKKSTFEREKYFIQIDLLKMQEWIKEQGKKMIIVFEGRDAAGKGSTIKRFIEYLNPRGFRVVALDKPTPEEKRNWFQRYETHFPKAGEIVFFDRSWYNRAVVEPVMGYCSEEEYKDFMENVNDWERSITDSGIILIKFWFSITKEKQEQRFEARKKSPLKYWKFSPNDAKVIDKYEIMTFYKNQMFNRTSTDFAPWVIINSNDKKVGILNSMRYVLSQVEYPDKNPSVIEWYPEVVNILKLN